MWTVYFFFREFHFQLSARMRKNKSFSSLGALQLVIFLIFDNIAVYMCSAARCYTVDVVLGILSSSPSQLRITVRCVICCSTLGEVGLVRCARENIHNIKFYLATRARETEQAENKTVIKHTFKVLDVEGGQNKLNSHSYFIWIWFVDAIEWFSIDQLSCVKCVLSVQKKRISVWQLREIIAHEK